jgi:hypothetical protein
MRHEAPKQPSALFSYTTPTSAAAAAVGDSVAGVSKATELYAAAPESTNVGWAQPVPSSLCHTDRQQRPC